MLARNPIVTSDGWIYDKEAVLKYILDKKEEYRKQLKVYESQTSQEFKTISDEAEKDLEKKRKAFEKSEQSILSTCKPSTSSSSSSAGSSRSSSTSHAKVETSKGLPSFWVPNLTPQVMLKTTLKSGLVPTHPVCRLVKRVFQVFNFF